MGNCLKSPTSDDISLLHESQSDRASYGDPDLEPPPPYQVTWNNYSVVDVTLVVYKCSRMDPTLICQFCYFSELYIDKP